jgi:hypothetical protein
MMSAEGMPSYFLILEHDPVCLEWGKSQPFTCDPENSYFHESTIRLAGIDSLFAEYELAADSAAKETSYQLTLDEIQRSYDEVSASTIPHARIYLLAELLIQRSKLVRDVDQLASWKTEMLDFADQNYDILARSDYLGNIAMAYVGMNKDVMKSEISRRQAMEYDVETWIDILGAKAGTKEMIDFFIIRLLNSGEASTSARLVSKYNDYVRCELYISSKLRNPNMPYTFNVFGGENFDRVYNLDQFSGMSKVLALVSTDCPASVAAVSGLYEFLMENQIRLPVILVHEVEPEGKLAGLLAEKAPFGLQTGFQTGSTLMFGAGVEQLPAFMLLDRNNLQQQIIYDLDDLKQTIGGGN